MILKKNNLEITYTSVVSDRGVRGVRIERDLHGNINVYDDPTDSYLTWDKSYDEIFDELYSCWLERVKVKKYSKEAYVFERNIGRELDKLTKKILSLEWKPRGYFEFLVHHPTRIISAPFYEDRIVEEWLTDNFLKPYAENIIHPNNVACQTGKGPVVAQNYLKETLAALYEKYGRDFYFLQYDIKGYFDNLSHDRIKEQYSGMQALGYVLLCNIIDDWVQGDGYAAKADPAHAYGVPKGNLPSQWAGIMYLNDIDWYVSEREDCLGAVRYMDDAISFFKAKESCKDCKIKIEKHLEEKQMGIVLHPQKTVYAPISRGFSFCGWHYTVKDNGEILLSVKRERKKLTKAKYQKITDDYYTGKLSFADVKTKQNGTYAFLKQGDTRGFRRYLSDRYRLSHDADTHYNRKKEHLRKQQNNTLCDMKEETLYGKKIKK